MSEHSGKSKTLEEPRLRLPREFPGRCFHQTWTPPYDKQAPRGESVRTALRDARPSTLL
jgi:hypothetical protein